MGTEMTDTDRNAEQKPDEDDQAGARRWSEMLQHAHTRPQMYIGGHEDAHWNILKEPMRLVWQANVFRRPQQVRVDLSPHQCVVRCDTGPLIRPVQQMFSFPGGRVLGDTWGAESRAYFAQLDAEEGRNPQAAYRPLGGWRYCFRGPTGPRLAVVGNEAVLARRLTWGLRTDQGLWCQAYEGGWPLGTPFLVEGASTVGLIVIADLDPQYWTGLPYDAEDVQRLREMSHKQQGLNQHWKPRPAWSTGEIIVNWHDTDDLVPENTLAAYGVSEWLA